MASAVAMCGLENYWVSDIVSYLKYLVFLNGFRRRGVTLNATEKKAKSYKQFVVFFNYYIKVFICLEIYNFLI